MCNYITWYQDNQAGYVVQCSDCNRIQAAFGNLAITFTTAEFQQFRLLVNRLYGQRHPAESPYAKAIMAPTPCPDVNLLLSNQELEALHTMIETADNEMRAHHLLQAFKGQ